MAAIRISKSRFAGALLLDGLFPARARRKTKALLSAAAIFLGIGTVILPIGISTLASLIPIPVVIAVLNAVASINLAVPFALFVFLFPFLFAVCALDAFFFAKTASMSGKYASEEITQRFDYHTAEIFWKTRQGDSTELLFAAIQETSIGSNLLLRLAIDVHSFSEFLASSSDAWQPIEKFADTLAQQSGEITFPIFIKLLFENHHAAKIFLDHRDISLSALERTANWLSHAFLREDQRRRWWQWENLARKPGLGKQWSYGLTPILQQYAYDMESEALRAALIELIGKDREIKLLESALLKDSGANVILVGEAGSGRHTVLLGLVRMIAEGTIFPELEDKHVFHLQGPALVAAGKTKGEIEAVFIGLLNEAVKARNIILSIDEFPAFVDSMGKVGVNVAEILAPYLAHPHIHILAIADTLGFRTVIENNSSLLKYFERIDINEPEEDRLIEILEDHVPSIERCHGKIFMTYEAIETAAHAGIESLVAGALPKRAIDLLEEVAEEASEHKKTVVLPDLVRELVTQKTKMPLGDISPEEQEKLQHLEELLRKRVIGQEEAVKAVADAVRRARSGIKNPKRPIGSFLFLGPTGVGKTETAKALADSYFGSEDAMLRFDMTEYQNEDGFEKLVGSFDKNEPGLLTSHMRDTPYALVLLDEFEKCNQKVKNLFLQVLDEGFFSDYLGRKINMRNTIIVATSNAGAKLIWDSVEKGIDPSTLREQLFSYIQSQGLYTPELLNRFDATIIYHPLGKDVLAQIARTSLEKFAARLDAQKNISLSITEPLVAAVAKGGYDPVFGARPMQRFLQDKVEKIIADKIIAGDIKSGSQFSFSPQEVATLA